MPNIKKLMLAAAAAALLIAATPLAAQYDGIWEGGGDGYCYAPDGSIIYPWQSWNGTLESGVFTGEWEDVGGAFGDFTGGIIYLYTTDPPSHTMAHCEGTWTWMSPEGDVFEMGPFEMEFDLTAGTCEGTWWTIDNTCYGNIWGEQVGE